MKPIYKRILLKLSGEGLAGKDKTGIDTSVVGRLAAEIKKVRQSGVQVCLVIGGGNFFRGARNAGKIMDRSVADQIGMMATVMNALAMKSALESIDCPAVIYSGLNVPQVCNSYNFCDALRSVNEGKVVIFAGGTGNPYFTTDTGAALRAVEMHCDILMKATQVDGVYSADPRIDSTATRYDKISYNEVLERRLNVMDMTALAMLRDAKVPTMIFAQAEEQAIYKAVCGQIKHTIINE